MARVKRWVAVRVSSPDQSVCHVCRSIIPPRQLIHTVLLQRRKEVYERRFCSVECAVPWLSHVVLGKPMPAGAVQ